jgi:radical SAM protein with 4Fe4S-binding SPASM domain
MSFEDFKESIDFIANAILPRIGVGKSHFLTVEYLGGEVLIVPADELEKCVMYARSVLTPLVRAYRDGAQSNLIGSERRVLDLHDLFNGNIGTSWDQHSDQRNIKGSPQLYRGLLNRSLNVLERDRDCKPGRVLVIDRATAPFILQEVSDAIAAGYDLVLRPVFQGGTPDIDGVSADELSHIMTAAYAVWSKSPVSRIEPFYSLANRRFKRAYPEDGVELSSSSYAGCPFQSDCAFKSLALDPDGSLYICQEMADSNHYTLGNAIQKFFEEKTWRLLSRRTAHLSDECATCEWKSECGGGCMNEAIEAHGDPFAKTELCPVWKSIFHEIEKDIECGALTALGKKNQ